MMKSLAGTEAIFCLFLIILANRKPSLAHTLTAVGTGFALLQKMDALAFIFPGPKTGKMQISSYFTRKDHILC